jgi:hypothetical protein
MRAALAVAVALCACWRLAGAATTDERPQLGGKWTWTLEFSAAPYNENNYINEAATINPSLTACNYSVVAAGESNVVEADYATIGGGSSNTVKGKRGVVRGGQRNTAKGEFSSISGGAVNKVHSNYGVVLGGYKNTVRGRFGSVLAGSKNVAAGRFSVAVRQRSEGSAILIVVDSRVRARVCPCVPSRRSVRSRVLFCASSPCAIFRLPSLP